ncbi:hypothetical protein BCR32DRAFT_326114 [Anaeromyces robustus]|uniref:TFIIS-type domain-containing protein n=1 Tax=Anaeromyces robustus TaxID=1754192 RepID=A0A1Y1XE94_9FUNG|nr:hypothetical protein BCR32DRAFT_326114 [Anaeromyces robustus]|eukprot:ORX84012.1 hypothetical protein BCR32DRAFT_326114 [Anaeromyces robustus]
MEFTKLNLDLLNIDVDDELKAPIYINYNIVEDRFKDKNIFKEYIDKETEEYNNLIKSYVKLDKFTKKCKRCNNENVNVNIIQTRRTDESSTIVYTCKTCGFKEFRN